MERRLPRAHDLAPLLQFKKPVLSPRTRRLEKALTIDDLRRVAKRRTPKAAFDYTDGAADAEVTLARARQAFADIEFVPSILHDVSKVDTTREVLGSDGVAAVRDRADRVHPDDAGRGRTCRRERGRCRGHPVHALDDGHHHDRGRGGGEPGGSQLVPAVPLERPRSVGGPGRPRGRGAGYDTLLVTVDVPVAGARLRDTRNGMTIPPTLTPRTVIDALPRPAWWWNFLTTEPLAFASLSSWSGSVADLIDTMFDPTVTYADLAWIREHWKGNLVVKGVQSVADARRTTDAGADAVLLSNHGGRQLDRAPVPFRLLPEVVREVGADTEVWIDTGIMSGQDIVAAVAHGASFTLVGRAYLYGLMAGGRQGVDRSIEILQGQIERTMRLLGVTSLDELEPGHVRMLS